MLKITRFFNKGERVSKLISLIKTKHNTQIIKDYIKQNPHDINVADESGLLPLHWAATTGNRTIFDIIANQYWEFDPEETQKNNILEN